MNLPEDYTLGRDHFSDEGDVLPRDYGKDWITPEPDIDYHHVRDSLGSKASLQFVELPATEPPVTGVCAQTIEQYTQPIKWQQDLIALHNLGLGVFSHDDYRTMRAKEYDMFQRMLTNFRRALENHYKRIELVDGDEELDSNLRLLYGDRPSSELMTLAELLRQLAGDIDAAGLITDNELTKKELNNARSYLQVHIVRNEAGRLVIEELEHPPLSHSA